MSNAIYNSGIEKYLEINNNKTTISSKINNATSNTIQQKDDLQPLKDLQNFNLLGSKLIADMFQTISVKAYDSNDIVKIYDSFISNKSNEILLAYTDEKFDLKDKMIDAWGRDIGPLRTGPEAKLPLFDSIDNLFVAYTRNDVDKSKVRKNTIKKKPIWNQEC